MLNYNQLKELSDPKDLTPVENGGKLSALSRGLPYYGRLRKNYPVHWMSFYCMHHRDTPTDYSRNCEGFIQLLLELGDVPLTMIKPTIGRKDHSKGYIKGNFSWQESSDNSTESANRVLSKLPFSVKSKAARKAMARGTSPFSKLSTCPHCSKTGHAIAMKRWHFDNCKSKINGSVVEQQTHLA